MERPFRLGLERFGMKIKHLTIICQRLKTMGKAFGDQQASLIRCGQSFTVPPQKGG